MICREDNMYQILRNLSRSTLLAYKLSRAIVQLWTKCSRVQINLVTDTLVTLTPSQHRGENWMGSWLDF